jgi:S1-C subfamily serine protease
MSDSPKWEFPAALQPKADDYGFDLDAVLDSVVLLRAEVPADAYTAGTLGTERGGYGVVIRPNGLILTIGYLITEAQTIWLTTNRGQVVAGHPLAYDQATGFGLVIPLGKLNAPALEIGTSKTVNVDDPILVVGHGGRAHTLKGKITDKREFAGYWEYVLDEALFAAPAHPQWGGSALVDGDGQLVGIGSLFVQESQSGTETEGNMFVPIDLLEPILEDLLKYGAVNRPPRPWLGFYVQEAQGQLIIGGLAKGGPAEKAGVKLADVVLEVGGERVSKLPQLFRRIWAQGPAGTDIVLTLAREGAVQRLKVPSSDRGSLLKKPQLH